MENISTNGAETDVRHTVSAAKETLKAVGDKVYQGAEDVCNSIQAKGEEAYEACKETGSKQIMSFEKYVKDNPVKSVLAAVGAGLLLSRVCKN